MGLDAVELLLWIEDEFKIAIADEEAADCRNAGDLTNLVYSKLKKDEDEVCLCQRGFYLVRRVLIERLQVPRKSIRPETPLKELIKRAGRRKRWKAILDALSPRKVLTASLTRPLWLKLIIFLIIPMAVVFGTTKQLGYELSILLAVLSILPALLLTVGLKYEFPSAFTRVKDLIRIAGTLSTITGTRKEVFEKVKRGTAEVLGVDEAKVTEHADFIRDLGMG